MYVLFGFALVASQAGLYGGILVVGFALWCLFKSVTHFISSVLRQETNSQPVPFCEVQHVDSCKLQVAIQVYIAWVCLHETVVPL